MAHVRPDPTDPLTALTKTASASEAHSRWHGRTNSIWENVKAHGAVGDNVADDGAEIQAAIDAAGSGGTVFFPPGTYKFATGLTFVDGTKLIGSARGGVTLSYTGSGKALSQTTPSTRIYDCQFKNFVLVGTAAATHGIDLDSVTDCLIDDVAVTAFTAGIGIRIYSPSSGNSVYNHLENVIITSCATGLNISGTASNANTFHAGRIASCTTYGVNIENSNATVVSETAFESNTVAARLYDSLGGATIGNEFTSNRHEANTTDFIFDGCRFNTVASPSTIDGALVISTLASVVTGYSNNIIEDARGYGLRMESISTADSPYILKRAVNVAGGYPAVLIQDTATGSTSPIAVQIEQEDDGTFINMKKGGVSKFDVSTAGAVTAASTVTTTGITSSGAISDTRAAVALTDGATIAVDASQGSVFTCALGGSRTISAPSNATNNQIITLRLGNNTAGAIVTTWAAGWIMSTWTDPAAGKYRTISFVYVSSSGNWWEIGRTAADI